MSELDYAATVKKTHTNLKSNALNFWEVLAQAIALISPSKKCKNFSVNSPRSSSVVRVGLLDSVSWPRGPTPR